MKFDFYTMVESLLICGLLYVKITTEIWVKIIMISIKLDTYYYVHCLANVLGSTDITKRQ